MPCKICNDLTSLSTEEDLHFLGRFSINSIRKNAERGCDGCQILLKASEATDGLSKYFDCMEIYLGDRLHVRVSHSGGYHEGRFPFVTKRTPWPSLPVYSILPPVAPTLASSIPRIKTWLHECTTAHQECSAHEEALLPTRVIDVGVAFDEPKLHISQPDERAEYCALSHCWGAPDPHAPRLTTTRDNFENHKRGIPSFPRTFRQAVEVVRELGLRFLWIDSLCIIQGDAVDWEHEASRMAAVYSNATLVLAADWSPNSAGGLFPPHTVSYDRPSTKRHTLIQKDKSGISHEIILFEEAVIDHAARGVYPCIHVYNTQRLAWRAWCLQERALARRIVHFCDAEILWECRHSDRPICVCGGSTHPSGGQSVGPSRFNAWTDAYLSNTAQSTQETSPEGWCDTLRMEVISRWKEMVSEYTRRRMTYATDRLSAISGLARRLPVSINTRGYLRYIAGMWYEQLNEQLAWYNVKGAVKSVDDPAGLIIFTLPAEDSSQVFDRLPQGYAPSWSWASISASVDFVPRSADLEVVHVSYNLTSSDPFGPVSSATLTIKGHSIPVTRLSALSVITPVDELLGHGCRVSWDAGSEAREWCDEESEYAVLVVSWEYWNFFGLVIRRKVINRRLRSEVVWQRIGLIEKTHDALIWKEAELKERQKEWMANSAKVILELE